MLMEKEGGFQMTELKSNEVYEGPLDANGFPLDAAPKPAQVPELKEPEFGPLRSGYKGVGKEVEEALPEPEKKSNVYTGPLDADGFPLDASNVYEGPVDALGFPVETEEKEASSRVYYSGTGIPIGRAGMSSQQAVEQAEKVKEEFATFGRDVPRVLQRAATNLTATALNSFAPREIRDAINNLPEKQRNAALNTLTEKAVTYAVPLLGEYNWDDPETVDADSGRIKRTEGIPGMALDMGVFAYAGNKASAAVKISNAAQRNFPRLASTVEEIIGYSAAGAIFLDLDENLANVVQDAIVDPEDPDSEYLGKSVVDFMAAKPDDTVTEKQLKTALETASLTVVIRGLIAIAPPTYQAGKQAISAVAEQTNKALAVTDKVLTKPRQLIMGKRPEEMTKEEADEAFMSYIAEQKKRDSVLNIDTLEETEEGVRQIQRQSRSGKKLPGQADALLYNLKMRFFTSRGLKTPLLYEAMQNAKNNQRRLLTSGQDTANRIHNAFKAAGDDPVVLAKTNDLLDTDLSDVFELEIGEQVSFLAKRESIPEDVASEILTARQSIDELSQKALDTPGFTDEAYAAIKDGLGVYLRRSYEIFENAGFSVDAQLKETARAARARALVQKEISKADDAGDTLSTRAMSGIVKRADDDARIYIDEMLEDAGPLGDFVAQSVRVNKFYQRNEDLTPEIKAMLGEIKDPGERVILSVQKAARIVEMQNFYNTTMKLGNGKYIFNAGTAGQKALGENGKALFPTKIENTNSTLDGMYTTVQIAESIAHKEATFAWVEADNVMSEMWRYFVAAKGMTQSMKTIYSLSTQTRNAFGSYQFGVGNGYLTSQLNEQALKVLTNRLNKTVTLPEQRKVYDEMYQEYQGLGIINTQTSISQYKEMMEESFESAAKRRKQLKEATSDIPVLGKAVQKLDKAFSDAAGSSAGKLALRTPAETYTATDDFIKIGMYEAELKNLKEAFPNADIDMLKRQAANTIKNTVPNYDRVPNSLKALGKSPVGNFIAFPAEVVRTSGHILKQSIHEVRSSNSVIRQRGLQRIAGFAAMQVGFYGIAKGSQIALGMSDQEVEDRKLLSSGPWSAGHDTVWNRDPDTGKLYGLQTQYLNSYYTVQAPVRTGLDTFEDGVLKGDKWDTIAGDVIMDALLEVTQPYITESIATGPIRSLITGWLNESGRDSEGMQIRDDKSGYLWDNILGKFYDAFEPGIVTKGSAMVDALKEKPSDYDQSYRDPKYEAWSQVGIKWDEQDIERDTSNHIRNFKILARKNKLDYIKISSKAEDITEDIMLTNSIEFQHQQDLYVYIQAARRQIKSDAKVISLLREEGYSPEKAVRMMRGQFTPQKAAKGLLTKHALEISRLSDADSLKFQDLLKEIEANSVDLFNSMDMLPLDQPFETRRERLEDDRPRNNDRFSIDLDNSFLDDNPPLTPEEREEAGLSPMAVGGVVSTPVPNAPAEPDERIDKLTGLPYNERAGTAYMDISDPLRALNMAAGGRVQKNVGGKVLNALKRNCN